MHLGSNPSQTWSVVDTSNLRFVNHTRNPRKESRIPLQLFEQDARPTKRQRIDTGSDHERQPVLTKSDFRPTRIQLRTNNPLKISDQVHMDVWRIVLKHSDPKFLLQAKTLSRSFYKMLDDEAAIWTESLNHHYRFMPRLPPDAPDGMSAQQYVQLLEGKGCQNTECAKKNTGKVYWAFRVRLCDVCILQKSIRDQEVEHYRFHDTAKMALLKLVPAGVIDSGKYNRARQMVDGEWENPNSGSIYLKTDVDDIEKEFDDLLAGNSSTEDLAAWRSGKRDALARLMRQTKDIEAWVKGRTKPSHRDDRAAFFQRRAAQLTPPINKHTLGKFMAYKMSLDARTPATEKQWQLLKSKIMLHRHRADQLVLNDRALSIYLTGNPPPLALRVHLGLKTSRENSGDGYPPEKTFVLKIARDAVDHVRARQVADADLVLLVLREVYERYKRERVKPCVDYGKDPGPPSSQILYQIPRNLQHRPPTHLLEYRLVLDDARCIIEEIIAPHVKAWNDSKRAADTLESFKCVGCRRTDCTARYTFVKGLDHVHSKHAGHVGENLNFDYFARPHTASDMPWYTVPWPRNLPLVASHHEIKRDDVWHPDDNVPYLEATKTNSISIFLGKKPVKPLNNSPNDFGANLIYAATLLRPTSLGSEAQTKIMLHYALSLYLSASDSGKPDLHHLTTNLTQIQAANPKLSFRYRCSLCTSQTNVARTTKFIKSPVQFHELEEHWEKKHAHSHAHSNSSSAASASNGNSSSSTSAVSKHWTTHMMDLPSEAQLLTIVEEEDKRLEEQKRAIKEREASIPNAIRKKANAKAPVVLGTPRARDVFDILFEDELSSSG